MSAISFFLGANAIADTVPNAITALQALTGATNKRVVVIFWDDVKSALPDGAGQSPDSSEDWLAALLYNGVDKTAQTQNSERRASFSAGGLSIDQGFYLPNNTFIVRPVTVSLYSASSLENRPNAADL